MSRVIILALLLCVRSVQAAPEAIPEAYQMIAHEHGVPPALLYAISLNESAAKLQSGKVRPWPWTLNIAGEPKRYLTRLEAYNALRLAIKQGVLVDVGLGQVNWNYNHAELLDDPWLAFDPYFNLRVAARMLSRLHASKGGQDWWPAVGAYHSPGSSPKQRERAQRYIASVQKRYHRIIGREHDKPPVQSPAQPSALARL